MIPAQEPLKHGDVVMGIPGTSAEGYVFILLVGADGELWRWMLVSNKKSYNTKAAVKHNAGEFGDAYTVIGNITEILANGIYKTGDVGRSE